MNIPPYLHALERGDLKRYPVEITKVPNREPAAPGAAERESSFTEIAAEVEAAKSNEPLRPPQTGQIKPSKPFAFWQNGDFSFGDFLDIINPLQHVPIVATLYRNMSGDQIGAVPRVIGGALWGRIGGFVSGLVNAVVDWFTGKDIGDHIYAALFGNGGSANEQPAVAQARKLDELSSAQAAQQAMPQNSFADEGLYSVALGRDRDPPAAPLAQIGQPQTPPTSVSAVNSYEQNSVANQPITDSRVRFFA